MFSRALVFLLIIFSGSAFAADYSWIVSGLEYTRASSPAKSCDLYSSNINYDSGKTISVWSDGVSRFWCRVAPKSGPGGVQVYIYREGTTCPAGTTYDPAIVDGSSQCKTPEEDKCAATIGQSVTHQHNRGTLSEGGVILQNTLKEPPGAVCDGICQYAYSGERPTSCYRFVGVGGDQNSAFCTYRYQGNGVQCQASDTAIAAPPADLSPKREKKNECTQKVTDAEGRVHYSCLDSDKMEEPGNMQCGEVNGKFGCVAGKPSPQKIEKEVKTEVSETKSGDGSSTTNTTTTNNTTNCTGVNACSTTTSVTNGTSKTNADGTSGGESSTCTGSGCKESTGEEEKEEEEEENDEVTGDECGQPLSCSGDVIQCAVLKQQKQSRCDWNYQDAKPGIESEIVKPEYQVSEDSHDMSGLFSSAIGAARWLPSSCPAPERAGLRTRGAGSVQLSWQPTCDFASSMAPVIVAMASLFFALYVGRGIGGGA